MNVQQKRIVDHQITDLQKLQLFFCALRAKAMAEDAIEKSQEVQPNFRAFARELEKRWQEVIGASREASPEESSTIQREFARSLEEGLRQGEAEMQQSYLAGEDIEERFVFWWLLRLYNERSIKLEIELGSAPGTEEPIALDGDEPDASDVIDQEALSSFQAAMELAV